MRYAHLGDRQPKISFPVKVHRGKRFAVDNRLLIVLTRQEMYRFCLVDRIAEQTVRAGRYPSVAPGIDYNMIEFLVIGGRSASRLQRQYHQWLVKCLAELIEITGIVAEIRIPQIIFNNLDIGRYTEVAACQFATREIELIIAVPARQEPPVADQYGIVDLIRLAGLVGKCQLHHRLIHAGR